MSRLTDTDDPRDSRSSGDHEISLGVPTILGIFFALALVCAAFFGFGYTVGRKSTQNAAPLTIASQPSPSAVLKPQAGSLFSEPTLPHPLSNPEPPPATESEPVVTVPIPAPKNVKPSDTIIAGDKLPAALPSTTNPQAPISNTFMVQVAAVSSQEIADIELAALKKYGYNVLVRHEPKDELLHIQIGPFNTRKDAEAMRADVQAHGFNAIVK